MQLNRIAAIMILGILPIPGHAQQSTWLWWGDGTNSSPTKPVSVSNPLPVTPIGGGSGMLTNGSNATAAALQALATNASTATLFLGGSLGVGTALPTSALHVRSATASTDGIARFTTSDFVSGSVGSGFLFVTGANSGNTYSAIQAGTAGFSSPGTLSLNPSGGAITMGAATTFSAAVIGAGRIVSGTSDGPTASDCGGTVHFTSGSGITVTMPNSITTLQCTITFIQEGAGQITFAAGSGATIHSAHSYTKTFGQWAVVDMILNTNAGGTSAVYTLAGDGSS